MSSRREPTGYVYRITNKLTGEIYIGQHKVYKEPWRRYLGSSTRLREDVARYGRENFTKSLIAWAWSREELDGAELSAMRGHRENGYKIYNRNFGSPSFPIANTWENMDEKTRAEIMERRSQSVIASQEARYARIMDPLREEIIAHYLQCGQLLTTARHFQLPRDRVRNFLLAQGVALNARNVKGHRVSDESRSRISRGVRRSRGEDNPLVELNCHGCGERFHRRESAVVGGRGYCSTPCRVEDSRGAIHGASRGELEELYHGEGLSIAEIGELYNCGKSTVYARLKKLDIPRRRGVKPSTDISL